MAQSFRVSVVRAGALAGLVLTLALAPGPAAADWRDTVKTLRVGFVAGGNPAQGVARTEPFRLFLERRLGIPVEMVPGPTYAALIDAQATKRVDYAIYSAASFASASVQCGCVEPLATALDESGAPGFHAILVARASGAITKLADARGTRLALGGLDSFAGRQLPLAQFAAEGLREANFASRLEVVSPEVGIEALLAGQADVALAWSNLAGDPALGFSRGTLAAMVADGRLSMDAVRIVWQSPRIPYGAHAVRADLPDDLKSLLRASLLGMAAVEPDAVDAVDRVNGGGFAAVDAEAFAPLMPLVEAVPAP